MSKAGRKAVFTICKDEGLWLKIWYDYYSKHFAPEDMWVLNHESVDGCTSYAPCNIVDVCNPTSFDLMWLLNTVKGFQRTLLETYEWVLFTETDEIVWAEEGLVSFIDRAEYSAYRCHGYELLHTPPEPSFVPGIPVLDQRSWWYRTPLYDKPLLAREEMFWHHSFHTCDNIYIHADPTLYLVHLHRMDYDMARKKHEFRAKYAAHKDPNQTRYIGDAFWNWFWLEKYGDNNPIEPIHAVLKLSGAF